MLLQSLRTVVRQSTGWKSARRNLVLSRWMHTEHAANGSRMSKFTALKDCTEEDMEIVTELYRDATTGTKLAERALGLFQLLNRVGPGSELLDVQDSHLGVQVDLFEHGLQTATRCYHAGCDEEIVVAGLLHDIGELLSPSNHGEFSAALLRPYVSPHVSWMLEHHEVFQRYYYDHRMNPPNDRNIRRVLRGNQSPVHGLSVGDVDAYEFTVDFCERFDQASFDPSYSSMELKEFRPMVVKIFERPAYWHTPNHPKKGAVTGSAI